MIKNQHQHHHHGNELTCMTGRNGQTCLHASGSFISVGKLYTFGHMKFPVRSIKADNFCTFSM